MSLQSIASEFIGQKEKPGNSGFVDPDFEKLMKRVGWRKPLYWCAYGIKAVFLVAKERGETYVDMVSPSAVSTYNAYKKAGRILRVPKPGSLGVMQKYENGKPTQFGHIYVVDDPRPVQGSSVDGFYTIEFNSGEDGSRNGDGVYRKLRTLTFAKKRDGLVLLGFCDTEM